MGSPTSGRPRGRPAYPLLTPAEERVLAHLRGGLTNAEIATRLGVTPDAVKYHVSNMLGKLGLENREQLRQWREPSGPRRWLAAPWLSWKLLGAGAASLVAVVGLVAMTVAFFGTEDGNSPEAAFRPGDLFVGTVSVGINGEPADGPSRNPSISGDGRLIAFESEATNLVPNDTNGVSDVFVFDRLTKEVRRVSMGMNGEEANGPSYRPSISEAGKWVAFDSQASNLVPDDVNGELDRAVQAFPEARRTEILRAEPRSGAANFAELAALWGGSDVFVVDLRSGEVELVSVTSEEEPANLGSFSPAISGDGRFVAFESTAPNLAGLQVADGGPPGGTQFAIISVDRVFLRDRRDGTTTLVSANQNGEPVGFGSGRVAITDDGSVVAFASRQTDLAGTAPAVMSGGLGQFVWKGGALEAVAWPRPTGADVDARLFAFEASGPAISPDGNAIAFATHVQSPPSSNGPAEDGVSGLFVWVRGAGAPVPVPGTESLSRFNWVNFDFLSDTELVVSRPGDPRYLDSFELVLYDIESGRVTALPGPGNLLVPRVSADGRSITAMLSSAGPGAIEVIVFAR